MRSVHPQLGEQGFPLTRPELCFLGRVGGRRGLRVGEPAKVKTSEIMLSRHILKNVERPIILYF